MIKAVFFDLANTLVYKPDIPKVISEVLSKYGFAIDEEVVNRAHRYSLEELHFPNRPDQVFYEEFNSHLLLKLSVVPNVEIINDVFHSCQGLPWRIHPDTSVLGEIKLKMGVASNWDQSLQQKLNQWFDGNFEWVIGSADIGIQKPERAFFEKMAEISNTDFDEIMFVGDSIRLDIAPALEVGIRAVLIDRFDLFESTTFERIQDLNELTELL